MRASNSARFRRYRTSGIDRSLRPLRRVEAENLQKPMQAAFAAVASVSAHPFPAQRFGGKVFDCQHGVPL